MNPALHDAEAQLATQHPRTVALGGAGTARQRAAQRVVRSSAACASPSGERPGGQWSKAMAMSLPRMAWIRMDSSGELTQRAVEVGSKAHPFFGDLGQRLGDGHRTVRTAHIGALPSPQAKHLKAARVGQHRPRPATEAMQVAVCSDDRQPGRSHR